MNFNLNYTDEFDQYLDSLYYTGYAEYLKQEEPKTYEWYFLEYSTIYN